MQVDFSGEIKLVNELRGYLYSNGWDTIQLVCSGGQAHMSISYKKNNVNKTIFPDVVALKNNIILLGEVKEFFDFEDEKKLLEIFNSSLAQERLKKNISIRLNLHKHDLKIVYVLIHSDINSQKLHEIYQLVFDGKVFSIISPYNKAHAAMF